MLELTTLRFILTALSGAVLGGSVAVWVMRIRIELRDRRIKKLMDTISKGGEDGYKR